MTIGSDALTEALGSHIKDVALKNQRRWAIEKSSTLVELTKMQIEKVVDKMEVLSLQKGDVLYQKGALLSNRILIIHRGKFTCVKEINKAQHDFLFLQREENLLRLRMALLGMKPSWTRIRLKRGNEQFPD